MILYNMFIMIKYNLQSANSFLEKKVISELVIGNLGKGPQFHDRRQNTGDSKNKGNYPLSSLIFCHSSSLNSFVPEPVTAEIG
jgi:hypothetical protein